MLNKIYEQILKIVKNNYVFFIGLLIGFALMTIKLPYYINAPGGVSDISEKLEIKGYTIKPDSFNLAYVYEFRATLPSFLYSYINQNWELIPKEKIVLPNENRKEVKFRDQMMLKESLQNAIIVGYKKAGIDVLIKDPKLLITYIDENSKTNLKIGDEILSINNIKTKNLNDIKTISKSFNLDDLLEVEVKRDGEILKREAKVFREDDRLIIGIIISVDQEIETDPEFISKFDEADSGPSGGLMMSLTIYDTLTGSNLSKDKKIVGTGTIDIDGNVGEIGGIKYKIKGAIKDKMDIFFVPFGKNYEEIIEEQEENNYNITIVPVKTIDDAINYLKNL
ncbi:MAG: S16 family serine protease [Bacilli bacterium]